MLRLITFLVICILIPGTLISGNSNNAINQAQAVQLQGSTTGRFIKDLKTFVRSISKQKYQPESYWKEVDGLWESMQQRKQDLEGDFTAEQLEQIRKWEKRYHEARRKQSKLS